MTIGAFIALVLGAGQPASAVEQTGDLKGSVRDEHRQPIPEVLVALKGANLQGERAATSDSRGEFAFRALPPGSYSLSYAAPGYHVIEQESVVVSIGRETFIIADLIVEGGTETVTVIGSVPLVDVAATSTQDNYTTAYLEQARIGPPGRDYLSVARSGAGTGPRSATGGIPTVRGATVGENAYLVDGVDSTDPATSTTGIQFIYDAIQEIQFQTGGFPAEFGRATGGIANIVTKSGGNELSGSADYRYRDKNLSEKGDHFDPDASAPRTDNLQGTLGGPIVKDRLWFFVAGLYNQLEIQPPGSPSRIDSLGYYYLGKLTWQINPAHRLSFQLTDNPTTTDNANAGPLVAGEATLKAKFSSRFETVQYNGILSPNVLLHAQVAHYASPVNFTPESGDLHTIGFTNIFTGEQTRNATEIQLSNRLRDQANATLTWHVPAWGGDHTFKLGLDYQSPRLEFNEAVPGGEADDIAPDANGVLTPLFYNEVKSRGWLHDAGQVAGYFIQDEWQPLSRWTFNLGLRYDAYFYDDDQGRRVFDGALLEPRTGIAWNVTGDARNVIKIFGGVFAHPSLLALPRVVNTRANTTNVYVNEEIAGYLTGAGPVPVDLDGNGVVDPHAFFGTFGGPSGEKFAHDGNLNPTNVIEYSVAYERQISSQTFAAVTLVSRETRDIIEDTCNVTTGACVIDNLAGLTRKHVGAEVRLAAVAGHRFHLWSSYTVGRSRGNVEWTGGLGDDFDTPAQRVNRYGNLSYDATHDVKSNGYWDLPWSLQIGYGYEFTTGQPINRFVFDPYGRKFIRPRGYLRRPTFQQLDLDLRKNIPFPKTKLQAIVSIVNALDSEIVTQVNSRDPDLRATGYQQPRRYVAGVRWTF
ncbi:MAG: TonB-dependent receptor [Acidobacteria bacterium]|nr:TonB-dependent receptor [Acidobacteriota bacterium]